MLSDPGVRHIDVTEVHDRTPLILAGRPDLFEIQGPITEAAESIVEPGIQRPRPYRVIESAPVLMVVRGAEMDLNTRVLEDGFDDRRVPIARDCLVRMVEVRVLVGKPQREPTEHRCGDLRR